MTSPGLCEACTGVLLNTRPKVHDGYQYHLLHHRRVSALKAAAEEKCYFCALLWFRLEDGDRNFLLQRESRYLEGPKCTSCSVNTVSGQQHAKDGSLDRSGASQVQAVDGAADTERPSHATEGWFSCERSDGVWQLHIGLSLRLLVPQALRSQVSWDKYSDTLSQPFSLLEHHPSLMKSLNGGDTACLEALDQAREWLRVCCTDHSGCNAIPSRNGWNPTRLLNIIDDRGDTFRVFETTGHKTEYSYFTLSHRWGESQPTKLTAATGDELSVDCHVTRLPKTFQDAIHFTRRLGRRYLWIDSLCIMQDDQDDWRHESSLMGDVYMHGDCNLSALAATSDADGLYQQRHCDSTDPYYIHTTFVPPDEPFASPRRGIIGYSTFWEAEMMESELNSRGWVLQERVLSKRVLHFGPMQLMWECSELDASEMFPLGFTPGMRSTGTKFGFKAKTCIYQVSAAATNKDRTEVLLRLWDNIIETYSWKTLTVASDKLVAVSGIVNRLSALMKDKNVMGLWRNHMVRGLFWVVRQMTPHPRPQLWRAPTWSWASVDSFVYRGETASNDTMCPPEYLLEVLRLPSDQYIPSNAADKLVNVGIVLRGRLGRVARLLEAHCIDIEEEDFLENLGKGYRVGPQNFSWDCGEHGVTEAYTAGLLFFMPGLVKPDSSQPHLVESLILRCEDWATGTFTRFGVHESRHSPFSEIVLAEDPDAHELPCLAWDAKARLHTICVI